MSLSKEKRSNLGLTVFPFKSLQINDVVFEILKFSFQFLYRNTKE